MRYLVFAGGVRQEGLPSPRLIEAHAGLGFQRNGIWYLKEDDYVSDDGKYQYIVIIKANDLAPRKETP